MKHKNLSSLFEQIGKDIDSAYFESFPNTKDKFGLRFGKGRVLLTYNSYKKNHLDTTPEIAIRLNGLGFKLIPTHNKNRYHAEEIKQDIASQLIQKNYDNTLEIIQNYIMEKTK
jgi:hypothetical protein